MKVISVVGARPNFMKVAPLCKAFDEYSFIDHKIVHTGQHYDYSMNKLFFEQLGITEPFVHLNVGSSSHAKQTAQIMMQFEEILIDESPTFVLVVGDVNSTLACSLVASKMHIPVVHVEAGLRSGDRAMPEELNRIVTDHLSDYLFVSEESGIKNLEKEGIPQEKVFFVGNVMIDSLVHNLSKADEINIESICKSTAQKYGLVTLHRPSNVDSKERLSRIVELLRSISKSYPLIFPMHPRTKSNLKKLGLENEISSISNLTILEPQGYFEFLKLMKESAFLLTDSGGIQEETSYLNVPCITIRDNTERPVTCTIGSNTLIPFDKIDTVETILDEKLKENKNTKNQIPLWDGESAPRIVSRLVKAFS
jgi:UDP-N-acetylglucosamine 2-epimerase (non-hydrolysing)